MQQQIIAANANYLDDHITLGWQAFYINIMFAHSNVPASERFSRMRTAVEGTLYPEMAKRLERHYRRKVHHCNLPRLFLFGDLPVFKYSGAKSRRVVNGGLHLNGFLLISPRHQVEIDCSWGTIEAVFQANQKMHRASKIHNIHLSPIERDTLRVADYAMKTIKKGRLEDDAAIVLPLEWRPKLKNTPLDPLAKAIRDIQSELNVSEEVARNISVPSKRTCRS